MKLKYKKFCIILIALALYLGACFFYVNDYYHAQPEALAAFLADSDVQRQILSDGVLAYIPDTASAGLIFYPGGKVEYTAYEPLMYTCAKEGLLCVLVEMPFNLAVLDVDAAAGIQEMFPDIEAWYIGGHSLGGSMAASYLADNTEDFVGLVLLASYSTADLSAEGLEVLSVYGSEDSVLNREKYGENISNLPPDYIEHIIDGGNHAGFGMYGEQEGDGEALISNEAQIALSAAYLAEFIK